MNDRLRQLIQNVVDKLDNSGDYGDQIVVSRSDVLALADYLVANPTPPDPIVVVLSEGRIARSYRKPARKVQ